MQEIEEYKLKRMKDLRDRMFQLIAEPDIEKRHHKMDDLLVRAIMILSSSEKDMDDDEMAQTVIDVIRAFQSATKWYS